MSADPRAGMAQARALLGGGRAREAAEALRRVLAAEPGRLDALYMLGQAEIRQGRFEPARAVLEAARRQRPEHGGILHALAGVVLALGRSEEAVGLLEEAVSRMPAEPRLWHGLGLARHAGGLHGAALEAYERALALDPGRPESAVGRAKVLQVLGRLDQARAAFEAVLRRWPEHPEALEGMAVQLELKGRYQEALAMLAPTGEGRPDGVPSRVVRARLLRRLGRPEEGLALLEGLEGAALPAPERCGLMFELGDLLDALGRHREAFARYRAANSSAPGEWSRATHAARVEGIMRRWGRPALERLAGRGREDPSPVLVVGMPRSGTTLVEQVLASHPGIHGAGELTVFPDAARRLYGADGVADPGLVTREVVDEIADAWLAAAAGRGAQRRVDKMPANVLHLGLVQAVFPGARIVHCRRDPRDAGLSCYRQDFSALGLAWTRSLADIAAYHRASMRLMAHWREVLALPVLELHYEDLVADPATWTRRLVAFAGLDWDEACARFGAGDRTALTASHAQVRRGLYTDAVGRYRDYEAWLGPLEAAGREYERERAQG